ncbi:MAG TPA: hypothetical protein VGW78_07725 [Candidatus Babeliales bacterium]|jgi:hypothetical protein|nr:hypothetical protein [Candidatus Babeliales bacterium]
MSNAAIDLLLLFEIDAGNIPPPTASDFLLLNRDNFTLLSGEQFNLLGGEL